MKILVDMNLPPKIVELLTLCGIESQHWQDVGAFNAKDSELVAYACKNDYVILTCDLDFTALLAASRKQKPSIVQIRVQGFETDVLANMIALAVKQNLCALENGAILTIDAKRARMRLLPL